MRLASRTGKIDSSGIRKVFNLAAKLEDPVNLSIGQPHFDVPEPIKKAAVEAILSGKNKYTLTQGTPELREKVAAYLAETRDGWTGEEVMITSGVSGAILLALLVLVEEGDEVVIPDPYFVMYKHLVNLCGGTPVFVDTYPDFRLTAERLRPAITERTKVVLLNSPNNPSGAVSSRADLEGIAAVLSERSLLAVSDEIYDSFTYDGEFTSLAEVYPENTLLLGGFSKTWAMTGWRLGYAAGPAEVVRQRITLQQYTFVNAPSMVQAAGLVALDYDAGEFREAYRAKRDLIYGGLKDDFEVTKPGGAFYIFPKVPWGDGESFVTKAIEKEVLIIPGNVFSEKNTNFRISYAADDDTLKRGIDILCALARETS
jgi:aspartate aminotransferase/aminotransferase